MPKYYDGFEKEAYVKLLDCGIPEPIAEECIASRTHAEIKTVIEFLDRYGRYFRK